MKQRLGMSLRLMIRSHGSIAVLALAAAVVAGSVFAPSPSTSVLALPGSRAEPRPDPQVALPPREDGKQSAAQLSGVQGDPSAADGLRAASPPASAYLGQQRRFDGDSRDGAPTGAAPQRPGPGAGDSAGAPAPPSGDSSDAPKPLPPPAQQAPAITVPTGGGGAIVSAANMRPGESEEGVLEIVNRGNGGGFFRIRRSLLQDWPGIHGSNLSERLTLLIEPIRPPLSPASIFDGPMRTFSSETLGWFAPREARRYLFRVTFVDGGIPASDVGGDNAYQGGRTRLGIEVDWSASRG